MLFRSIVSETDLCSNQNFETDFILFNTAVFPIPKPILDGTLGVSVKRYTAQQSWRSDRVDLSYFDSAWQCGGKGGSAWPARSDPI